MSEHSHQQLRRLFDLAMAATPGDRAALLELECKGDAALKKRLEVMIAAAEGDAFLSSPTAAVDPDTNAQMATILNSATVVGGALREVPGTRIGPYKLLQQIGEGGFGSVFMAQQEQPVQRKVALKIIKLGMDTHQVVARFEQERQALAILDHPNIAKVFDAGATETGRPYFVMELCTGEPIDAYCDRNNLSIPERLELIVQVCNAVQHAHTKGIIHRDLKPGNVLVALQDGKPHAKVIDFGIAKATASRLTERTLFTEHRQIIGTPEYMSPEQAEGSLDIDTRTDVYALGVMLYELLTGSTPFTSRELRSAAYAEIQRIIREVEPPKPSTRLSQSDTLASVAARRKTEPRKLGTLVRGELDWIVMKALEKDRSRRYESASGLMLDIRRYLGGEAVVAAPPSAGYRLRKFVRRNRLPVAAGSAVGVALLLGLAGTAWQARVASQQRDVAMEAEAKEASQRKLAEAARAEALSQKTRAEEKEAEARKQEAEANRQAAIAKGVAQFQAQMLMAVNPEQMIRDPQTGDLLKDRVTVLQVVQSAIKSLDEGAQKENPEVEAGVRHLIGTTLRSLGRYEESQRVIRKALEIRRATLDADDERIAATLDNLAATLQELNQLDEAETMYREALLIRRKTLPPKDPVLALALNNLAVHVQRENKFDEAEKLFREAIAIQRAAPETERPNLAISLDNLGKLMTLAKNYKEGESLLRESLQIRLLVLPADHPQVALGKGNLAGALMSQRKYPEAEQLLREALAVRRAALPAGHPDIAESLSTLGSVLRRQEKLAEAEPVLREALEMNRATLPPGHAHIATNLNTLGLVLKDLGKLNEAEPLYRESLAIRRAALPAGHPDIATALNNLAVLLKEQGKFDEAEPLYREGIKIRRAALPEGHPAIATALGNLGAFLLAQNKAAEAEPLYLEALEIRRAAFSDDHPDVIRAIVGLADVQDKLGKTAQARALWDEAVNSTRKNEPGGSASLARLLRRSGLARLNAGDAKSALPLLEEAAAMAVKFMKPGDKQLAEVQQSLEDCKVALAGSGGKGDDAPRPPEKDAPK